MNSLEPTIADWAQWTFCDIKRLRGQSLQTPFPHKLKCGFHISDEARRIEQRSFPPVLLQ
jgi:hypothetical protein